MADHHADDNRDALIASLCALFLLSDSEIQDMADAIATAREDAAGAALDDALGELAIDVDAADVLSDLDATIAVGAEQTARAIAATYQQDLFAEANRFVDAWLQEHGTLDGCRAALASDLNTWAVERATWKADQIANYEVGDALDDGTKIAIDGLLNGDYAPDDLALSDITVTVLPETAAEPFCQEYAGQEYSLDDAADLIGVFPAHAGCPHFLQVNAP